VSEQAKTPSPELFVSAREAWLYEPRVSSEARIVGLYLARRFEMTPEWHPRERDISERCGVSLYAARKALIDLSRCRLPDRQCEDASRRQVAEQSLPSDGSPS
jgi:hypothetical protein